jgi:hypothetical protein
MYFVCSYVSPVPELVFSTAADASNRIATIDTAIRAFFFGFTDLCSVFVILTLTQ